MPFTVSVYCSSIAFILNTKIFFNITGFLLFNFILVFPYIFYMNNKKISLWQVDFFIIVSFPHSLVFEQLCSDHF